jgi:hypothetical protein
VPTEHGGWGLTLEPVLLGLLVAPSLVGLLLAGAAFTAFLARTPAKLALGDRWRRRRLPRTGAAERVVALELALLGGLVTGALVIAPHEFWMPLLCAAPLIGVELWYDVRARGRRLAPELAGAIGICSVATAIALADGRGDALAYGLWLVLAARVVATIPFVREQIARLHGHGRNGRVANISFAAGIAIAASAVAVDERLLAGAVTVAAVVAVQLLMRRRDPPRAAVIGIEQMTFGLAVVAAAVIGVVL